MSSKIYEIRGGPLGHVVTCVHDGLDAAIEKAVYLSVNKHDGTLLAVDVSHARGFGGGQYSIQKGTEL